MFLGHIYNLSSLGNDYYYYMRTISAITTPCDAKGVGFLIF